MSGESRTKVTYGMHALVLGVGALLLQSCGDGSTPPSETGTREQRIFVVNTASESLSVIDHDSAEVVATVTLGNRPHGQGVPSNGERIYVTTDDREVDDGEVIAVNTRTLEIEWRLPIGGQLNEPHMTRDDRFLFVPDLIGFRTVVVDVNRREIASEIEMRDPRDGSGLIALHNTYASHDGESMYVTAILSQRIAEIGSASHEITRILDLDGDPRPASITKDDRKMYVQLSDLHGFIELDLETGRETARVQWPEPPNFPPGYLEGESLPAKCHGIGIRPGERELWAATNLESAVYVYSLPDLEQLALIEVGSMPNWIAFSAGGGTAYVTNNAPLEERGTVSVIDTEAKVVRKTLTVGKEPKRIHRVDLR